jgi:hypothetical protein
MIYGLAESSNLHLSALELMVLQIFMSVISTPQIPILQSSTDDDLVECIKAFESEKSNAVGCDGISIKFLRLILQFISGHIQHILTMQ